MSAAACPACTPVDTITRYDSGVVFDGEGVEILAAAGLPDQFQLLFPAIKYIDVNTVPPIPYVPATYQYEYYEVEEASFSYVPLGIPSSLHSNRGYEVGIVYMDEFLSLIHI